jgi:hypothetical protein
MCWVACSLVILLAVFSWVFLCAPIAVRVRLTLCYQLGEICGRQLFTLYHLDNGVITLFLQSDIHRFRYASKENPAGNPAPTLVLELAPSR